MADQFNPTKHPHRRCKSILRLLLLTLTLRRQPTYQHTHPRLSTPHKASLAWTDRTPRTVQSPSSLAWASDSRQLFALSHDGYIHHVDVSTKTMLSKWLIHSTNNSKCIALEQIGAVIEYTHTILSMAISSNYDLVTSGNKKITFRALCGFLPSLYTPRIHEIQHAPAEEVDDSSNECMANLKQTIQELRSQLAESQQARQERDTFIQSLRAQRESSTKSRVSKRPSKNSATGSPGLNTQPIRKRMTSTKPSTLFVPIFAHATTAQVYSASNWPTLSAVSEKTMQEQAESQCGADQEKDDLNETIDSLRADLRTRDNSSSVLRIQLADAQRHLEKTMQEQAKSQRAADREKDDLNETIDSLRADLCTRDNSSGVLCIQLADAQRRVDGINHAHDQMHPCQSLYAQGRIQGAAECLLEFTNVAREDVRTNKFIIDWLTARKASSAATKFKVLRFIVYRVICDILERDGRLVEAVECFQQMQNELPEDAGVRDEREKWELGFKARCMKALEKNGDLAMDSASYEDAVTHYSTALFLDPLSAILLNKQSKARDGSLQDANALPFKLPLKGPLVPGSDPPQRVYHTTTSAFRTIEIKTAEDLFSLDNLVLVHLWLWCLLDPVLPFEDDSEPSLVGEDSRDDDLDTPFTNPRPPSSYTAASLYHTPRLDKLTRALRLLARLRQPFRALLLIPLSHGGKGASSPRPSGAKSDCANTIINPEHTVSFSKLGVLLPTGSSKSFDESADGYARAEGAAAVLIKRLDLAVADGDSIYSIIKGSAINANGKGKSSTMPEGDMQAETIKEAYQVAKRDPSEAFFVELHATGTKVGDPIETNTAGKVFSNGRDAQKPLRVGSVKSNIGHAGGCSFLASLVKVSLMLHHKEIIPNIRFTKVNPKIDFPALKMQVQMELESITAGMAASDGTWVTSISSYGVGGSNAHAVLESAETVAHLTTVIGAPPIHKKPLYLFSIGSLTEPTLGHWKDALLGAYYGQTDDRVLRSVARELGRQTRAYASRAFATGPSLDASLKFSKPVLRHSNASPKLCLVFAGQGPQHIFMGRQLAESYPAFLSAIQENDRILVEKYGQGSMLERTGLFVPGEECKLPANGVWPVQEVVLSLVSIQVALVDLVRSLGIKYDFVVGHSIGEIAMGYASGHYDREMAVGIAVARAAAMTHAEGNGNMAALGVSVQKAKTMIRKVLSQAKATFGLWIAGINSPQAVTVAGTHELIDAIIELANDPNAKVFAAKLRVTCAFHTPLMEPQEEFFKERVSATPLGRGTKTPFARVMSTTDGRWLDRDLDINYCWDNIRHPVLFGTAINKIISDEGPDGVRFVEIAPHPVLKAYLEQCGGEPITLIRRPNPKVPAQNTGEHYQLLEGIGNLLSTGFQNVDFDKLCASPNGVAEFVKAKLPEYAYNKSRCWKESGSQRSERLRELPRPVASPHFRVNVDSHPDLTGHIVFDAILYIESILENGAMVVNHIAIHKPFVLNGAGSLPGHAGCVINDDKWEFKATTTPRYDNGTIILDSVYASGSFSRVNPAYDEGISRTFDFQAKLAHSQGSVTGDEFYAAIPSAYRYQDHFRNYLKVVHEINDETSWGGRAYLTYLEIPEGTPGVFGKGYVIHPGVLDSITQCGLAMFINMETKQFDFNGVFLPVKIDAFHPWDSRDAPDLDSEIRKGIWAYFTATTWSPVSPYKSNYVIANSEGKVLFTIEGFEIALAPDAEPVGITDNSREERLTTVWQPKSFPASLDSLPRHSSLCSVFEGLGRDAATASRKVIRVADVVKTSDIAIDLDAVLEALVDKCGVVVEYFCVSSSESDADAKTGTLHYSHARSLVLESWNLGEDSANTPLARNGVVLLSVTANPDSGVEVEDTSVEPLTLAALARRFSTIPGSVIRVSDFVGERALLYAKITQSTLLVPANPLKTVIVHPFEHGKEGDLTEIAKNISSEAELWITSNDDAAGIGALGITSCLIAESPEYQVFSVLFEDHSLDEVAREKIVHDLRKNSLLGQPMKISKSGEVFVRRLVHGRADVKQVPIPAAGLAGPSGALAAYFLPALKASDVEIEVKALGIDSGASSKSALTFVGVVKSYGSSVARMKIGAEVVGITLQTPADIIIAPQDAMILLPNGINARDAVALPVTFLSAWIGLVSRASILASSTVLVYDGTSAAGSAAVQVAKRFNAKVFSTVASNGEKVYARGSEHLSPFGSYVHVQSDEVPEIPSGAASSYILNINRLAAASPAFLVPTISALLSTHASEPFIICSRTVTMSAYKGSTSHDVHSLVVVPEATRTVRIDPAGQLFDPRKSYILVGGCSELGVRITEWMVNHGARHVFLTSRRGPRGLTKVDNIKVETATVVAQAKEVGPIGGIFVMTVILHDANFTNLTQQSFDDVYQSKVAVLETLLSCIDPMAIDFILLFSTIGSVFGNAGQAAYCASQLYLDRIADVIPNTTSMSFPPITDSGIFKRLVLATKGKANTAQLTKTGMTTAQVCNFIGDSLVRKIAHYVPMLAINDVPETFPTCEPLLYGHLLPKKYLSAAGAGDSEDSNAESPASLLAALLSMEVEKISENALITSFGLDLLGATRYSNQLKSRLGIQVSQIELLGSMMISTLNELLARAGASAGGNEGSATDDGAAKYGHALVPILNDRLAYDEPYMTDRL
ncbi:hypothetical protein HD554DRAFT_2317618 [Boletus coccyginus]|nr:hypothetical protein HD554DRAFT_2317618 [Boletus coccyginus]